MRVLRYTDVSKRKLDERLRRRGAGEAARQAALESLERAGLVDDARVAASRVRSLAERGYGDAAIRDALEQEDVAPDVSAQAMAALEPERQRAARLLAQHGPGTRTLRRLAARGFDEETLSDLSGFADDL